MFRRCGHSSRSDQNAETLSQAAGELGPLEGFNLNKGVII